MEAVPMERRKPQRAAVKSRLASLANSYKMDDARTELLAVEKRLSSQDQKILGRLYWVSHMEDSDYNLLNKY